MNIYIFLANHSYVWGLVLHGEMRRGCGRIRGIIDLLIPFHFIFLICVKRGRPIVCHFLRFMGYGVMHFFRLLFICCLNERLNGEIKEKERKEEGRMA